LLIRPCREADNHDAAAAVAAAFIPRAAAAVSGIRLSMFIRLRFKGYVSTRGVNYRRSVNAVLSAVAAGVILYTAAVT
jgi:hypothetical protein